MGRWSCASTTAESILYKISLLYCVIWGGSRPCGTAWDHVGLLWTLWDQDMGQNIRGNTSGLRHLRISRRRWPRPHSDSLPTPEVASRYSKYNKFLPDFGPLLMGVPRLATHEYYIYIIKILILCRVQGLKDFMICRSIQKLWWMSVVTFGHPVVWAESCAWPWLAGALQNSNYFLHKPVYIFFYSNIPLVSARLQFGNFLINWVWNIPENWEWNNHFTTLSCKFWGCFLGSRPISWQHTAINWSCFAIIHTAQFRTSAIYNCVLSRIVAPPLSK